MTNDNAEVEHVLERIGSVFPIRTRRMFGGLGIYHDEVFFALIDDDQVYYRVDDASRAEFEREGMWAFAPIPGKPSMKTYYALPPRVLASRALLGPWSRHAVEAARRAGKKRGSDAARGERAPPAPDTARARRTSRAEPATSDAPVGSLRNVGPKCSAFLAEIGVRTRGDLERMGSVSAYLALRSLGRNTSLSLLDALEGALLGLRYNQLSAEIKVHLRARVAASEGRPPAARAPTAKPRMRAPGPEPSTARGTERDPPKRARARGRAAP